MARRVSLYTCVTANTTGQQSEVQYLHAAALVGTYQHGGHIASKPMPPALQLHTRLCCATRTLHADLHMQIMAA
jgi:hypothetical protein